MSSSETITLSRSEYEELIRRNGELEDRLAAAEAGGDRRVPHEVALGIIGGASPLRAVRDHLGVTLAELSARTDLAVSYLSEIERGRKPGSVSALTAIAEALGTTLDVLTVDRPGP
ncbi:MAG: helix-turn-helix transcriptional regulator [bacterium]|nr:helix-turn-helix transcriptional regulator [bacterium]